MTDEGLKPIGAGLADLMDRFEKRNIECEAHGEQTVLVRRDSQNVVGCPACLEKTRAEAERAKWIEERRGHLHRIARIPQKYIGARFEPLTDGMKAARIAAKTFMQSVQMGEGWAVLMLNGPTGTGKTLLACEIGQALINRSSVSVRYATSAQVISEIKSSYASQDKSEEGEIQRFAEYGVLILDEADIFRGTDNDRLLLNEVINRRYSSGKPMIVATNETMDGLEAVLGDRIASRLSENQFHVQCTWPDFRRK